MAYFGEPYDPADTGDTLCACGNRMCREKHAYRIFVTSYDTLVADETFATIPAVEAFWTWYANQPDLPKAGSYHLRADLVDLRDAPMHEAIIPGIRDRFIAAKYGKGAA